ncbi:MAG: TIGR01212 family radical SAM protein [Desulfobacterales bacterium]|nr:TIGR01212 family radical SAM protein [Desulfobacterales bacterium]
MTKKRYYDLNTYYRSLYGCRVQKITIDAGMTCPNRDGRLGTGGCIYCNEKGSGTGAFMRGESIQEQLEKGKQFFAKRYNAKKFIAYFQSYTNTYGSLDHLDRIYQQALHVNDVVGLSIGTRPDCISEPILDLLKSYTSTHLIWLEYGLQSSHDTTLFHIHRGHNFACFEHAVEQTRNKGLPVCVHVILGLPGETHKMMSETAKKLANMNIDGIKIHLLYVVKDTILDHMYQQGNYACLEQDEYVNIVCDFLELLPNSTVIQRLTGDPHFSELVAPLWSLQKAETLSMIDRTLEIKNSWQGKRHKTIQQF